MGGFQGADKFWVLVGQHLPPKTPTISLIPLSFQIVSSSMVAFLALPILALMSSEQLPVFVLMAPRQQYDNTRGAWLTQEGCTIMERKERKILE